MWKVGHANKVCITTLYNEKLQFKQVHHISDNNLDGNWSYSDHTYSIIVTQPVANNSNTIDLFKTQPDFRKHKAVTSINGKFQETKVDFRTEYSILPEDYSKF